MQFSFACFSLSLAPIVITALLSSVKHDDHNNEHKQQQLVLAAGKNQFNNVEGVHQQQDDYSNSQFTDDKALILKELFVEEAADIGRLAPFVITAPLSSVKHYDHNNEHKQQQLVLAAGKNQFNNVEGVHQQQDDYSNSQFTDDKALILKELFVEEAADIGRLAPFVITAPLSSVKHYDHNNEHKQQQLVLAASKNQFNNVEGVHQQQDDYSNSHYTDDKALILQKIFVEDAADRERRGLKKSKTAKKTKNSKDNKNQKSKGGSSKSAKSTKKRKSASTYPSSAPSTVPTFPRTNAPQEEGSPAPTANPRSPQPTNVPSESPSATLSGGPSGSPSASPSESPGSAPSASPSEIPSESPSGSPSYAPSESPSSAPSSSPSSQPSSSPSAVPSLAPSSNPSLKPSLSPSIVPSSVPSLYPSITPSSSPSSQPSSLPSAVPSLAPSSNPSLKPSLSPSMVPSSVPSLYPSITPSSSPSSKPSSLPSAVPSLAPSSNPSLKPSLSPSMVPSSVPSLDPSITPSSSPSSKPSSLPSAVPSLAPSSNPSLKPSLSPSMVPSSVPSLYPSITPSSSPSSKPSSLPSAVPSLAPSSSMVPSSAPSTVLRLTASDSAQDDKFGHSVAISGDTIVIGANGDDDNGIDSGSVYVFKKDGNFWNETKLTAFDGATGDRFGHSVAISGDTIVIGAFHDDDNGSFSGSAYVFKKDGNFWNETKLIASDGATHDQFGQSVAISGDTIVIGANGDEDNGINSGSVYVFKNDNSNWTETKLTAFDYRTGNRFGHSVAISENTIVIGANRDDDNGCRSGSAYVFKNYNSTWIETKLTASDGNAFDFFGQSVAISGDTIVVGAPHDDDDNNGINSGSVYVF